MSWQSTFFVALGVIEGNSILSSTLTAGNLNSLKPSVFYGNPSRPYKGSFNAGGLRSSPKVNPSTFTSIPSSIPSKMPKSPYVESLKTGSARCPIDERAIQKKVFSNGGGRKVDAKLRSLTNHMGGKGIAVGAGPNMVVWMGSAWPHREW